MNIGKTFKEHWQIILFSFFVLGLTIYLGIDTLGTPPSNGSPQVVVPDPVEELPEETPEEGEELPPEEELPEVPEIPDGGVDEPVEEVTSNFPENRVPFITDSVESIDNHNLIVSTSEYDLYLKEENLSIILRNRNTGALLYSTVERPDRSNERWTNFVKSGVVIEYLQDTNIVYYQADMYSEDPEKTVTVNSDGFVAHVKYPRLEFEYELHVSLEGDVLTAHIPKESIIETSDRFKVANVYVYPFMGYTKMDEEAGYMFIPDGSGSLIHYVDHKGQFKQPFNQMIYGSNIGIDDPYVLSLFNGMNTVNENTGILMPVFGAVHTDKNQGFLGIIEQGHQSARLYAYPNGAILPYNWLTPSFVYRQFYNQLTSQTTGTMVIRQEEKNDFDIEIQYHLVSEENADYVGLAKVYQNYLEDKGVIENQDIDYKMRVDFLGSEVKSGLLFRQTVTMTTFDQTVDILNRLSERGVNETLSVFKGWQRGGPYTGLPHRSLKAERSLGNISVLHELNDTHEIQLESDLLRYNPKTNSANSTTLVKKLNKRTFQEDVYGRVFSRFNFITPQESLENAGNLVADYQQNDFESIAVEGIGNTLFSYLDRNQIKDRIHTSQVYQSIFEKLKNENMNISAVSPHALYWDYVDRLLDVQIESSNYVFVGEDVPFLEIVLKGKKAMYAPYTNFNPNHEENVLKMIEYGVYPSFIITHESASLLQLTNSSGLYSTQFEQYEDQIVAYDEIFKNIDSLTKGSEIIGHSRSNSIVTVTYDNDVSIVLNYNDHAVDVEGVTIDAMSYEVIQS